LALGGSGWSVLRSDFFISREWARFSLWIGRAIVSRTSVDAWKNRKISCFCRQSENVSSVVQLVPQALYQLRHPVC
jgi:hypothetical protein